MIAERYPAYENKPCQASNSLLLQRKIAQRYSLFGLGAERQSAVHCSGCLILGEVSVPGWLDLRLSAILVRKQRWHRIYSLSGWIAQVFNTRDSSILCALAESVSAVATSRFFAGEIFGTHPENSASGKLPRTTPETVSRNPSSVPRRYPLPNQISTRYPVSQITRVTGPKWRTWHF